MHDDGDWWCGISYHLIVIVVYCSCPLIDGMRACAMCVCVCECGECNVRVSEWKKERRQRRYETGHCIVIDVCCSLPGVPRRFISNLQAHTVRCDRVERGKNMFVCIKLKWPEAKKTNKKNLTKNSISMNEENSANVNKFIQINTKTEQKKEWKTVKNLRTNCDLFRFLIPAQSGRVLFNQQLSLRMTEMCTKQYDRQSLYPT